MTERDLWLNERLIDVQRTLDRRNESEVRFLSPTTKEWAFSGTSLLPIIQEGNCLVRFFLEWAAEVWEGGSLNLRFIRLFDDWWLEEVEVFFQRLHEQIIRREMEDYLVWLNMKSNNYFVGVDLCPFCCSMGDVFFGEWCPF